MAKNCEHGLSERNELLAKITELPSGCWFFNGAKDKSGFGLMRWKGKVRLVHRVFWESMCSPLDEGCSLTHRLPKGKCIGTSCCNPAHMRIREKGKPQTKARVCKRGHVINQGNMITENRKNGVSVRCRICRLESGRIYKREARAKLYGN
jgi:hypothetical protein